MRAASVSGSASRFAVLASGTGSNLQALLDAIDAGTLDARIVGVFSDKPGARALQRVPESLRWSRAPIASGADSSRTSAAPSGNSNAESST